MLEEARIWTCFLHEPAGIVTSHPVRILCVNLHLTDTNQPLPAALLVHRSGPLYITP